MAQSRLVVLLPVRNGAADLPGYFASVARFADAVVALDDGSTDATRELLAAEPLARIVLSNPRRTDYRGWHEAADRARLLAAAASLDPTWILSLDADERIDPGDAQALRTFVEAEALPGYAYGFRVHRMVHHLGQYDRAGLVVFRLFAFAPEQRFPDQRLHLIPVPTAIPRRRWLETTLRIQHVASLTRERRLARFEKYRQADPDHAYQRSYQHLLDEPDTPTPWLPRPPGTPVLVAPEQHVAVTDPDAALASPPAVGARPALSAIIIARDEERHIARAVASVAGQECPVPFEVIVVTSGADRTAEIVRARFPGVTLIALPRPALPGAARNAGLRVARGEYISFPGAHVELPAGSLAARVRAHDRGYDMVTGTTLNGTRTRAGWASYFLDHSNVLPGWPSTELADAPWHCSYRRDALLAAGGFPEDLRAGEDTVVNEELFRGGYLAYRAQDLHLIHHSPCRTPGRLLRHHFTRGRGYGRILRERNGQPQPRRHSLIARHFLPRAITHRLTLTSQNVRTGAGDAALVREYRRAFPLVVAAVCAAWAGTLYELVRPAPPPIDRVRLRRQEARPEA